MLRRTNYDKRRDVMRLLGDNQWKQWSNREIARRCGVSYELVNNVRSSLTDFVTDRIYVTKHGTVAQMDTANIGRRG
jgi:hypothetical protein